MLVFLPAFALIQFATDAIVRATHTGADEATIDEKSAIAYVLLTLYPTIAVTVKRLHDFNWSGWWAVLPILIYVVLTSQQSILLSDPNNIEQVMDGLKLTAFILAPFFVIGLIPGNRGPNRFGMPPP